MDFMRTTGELFKQMSGTYDDQILDKKSFIHNTVLITREDDTNPQKSLFHFVGPGKGNCFVRIDGYLIIPLEQVFGAYHARKDNPGFFEKLLISLGIYVIDARDHLSAYQRFKRFFRYWFASQNG